MACPSIIIFPDVGACKPAIKLSNVDLPQPEGPIIDTNVFFSIFRLISLIASNPLLFPLERKSINFFSLKKILPKLNNSR